MTVHVKGRESSVTIKIDGQRIIGQRCDRIIIDDPMAKTDVDKVTHMCPICGCPQAVDDLRRRTHTCWVCAAYSANAEPVLLVRMTDAELSVFRLGGEPALRDMIGIPFLKEEK